ncbi:Serine/threonine-protein kinase 16 [Blyttiomyces sp. JEL0837]|nr:Serine/threonine-protein kinase 16 [Blyttiomyces sp. JEL0837]
MSEPIGSQRNTLLARVKEFFSIVMSFISACLARFAPAPVVKIGPRSFKVLKQLGEGGFSFVYLVIETTPGRASPTRYALKRVRIQLPEQEERLKSEIAAHAAVNSPYVLKLLDSAVVKHAARASGSGGENAYAEGLLLLPFYGRGTVQDMIDRTPRTDFIDLKTILSISIDVGKGLMAFHSKNPPLAFRDLKPANILLDENGRAILMDLGSVAPARVQISSRREAMALQELCAETVTAPFRAPELFDPPSDALVDERTDVWALGCTIYNMAYGTPPFDGSMTAAMSGKVVFPARADPYGSAFRSLLSSILITDQKSRLSVDQVVRKLENLLGSLGGV